MAYITNSPTSTRPVYKEYGDTLSDEKGDFNKVPDLSDDDGMMNSEVSKNMTLIHSKAKFTKGEKHPIYDWKTKNNILNIKKFRLVFIHKMCYNEHMPAWRNGRRSGFKIHRWQHHKGSSPLAGTNVFVVFS